MPENSNRSRTLSTILLVSVLVLIALVAVFVYKYLQENAQYSDVPTTSESWDDRAIDSSAEGLDNYVEELTKQIESPNFEEDLRVPMIRKAYALGLTRSLVMNDNLIEMSGLLRSIHSQSPGDSIEDTFFRHAVIASFLYALPANCYPIVLGDTLPAPHNTAYQSFLDQGYHEKAAAILAYYQYARDGITSERYQNDRAVVVLRANLAALYLHAYGGNDTELDAELLSQLRSDIAQYPTTEPLTTRGAPKSDIEPALYFAYANDIAKTYGLETIDEATNAAVNQAYEDAFTINENLALDTDPTSEVVVRVVNEIQYIASIHRRYGAGEMTEKIDELIDRLITDISYSNDTRDLFAGYFIEGTTSVGEWMPLRNDFFAAARSNERLGNFVEEFAGINL